MGDLDDPVGGGGWNDLPSDGVGGIAVAVPIRGLVGGGAMGEPACIDYLVFGPDDRGRSAPVTGGGDPGFVPPWTHLVPIAPSPVSRGAASLSPSSFDLFVRLEKQGLC